MRLDIDTQASHNENNDIHLLPLLYYSLSKIADAVLFIGFVFFICGLFVLKFSPNILQLLLFVMIVLKMEYFKVCSRDKFLKIYVDSMLSLSTMIGYSIELLPQILLI